ncbi:UNVERIFIED_CONTAM: hypothetical protein Sradi_7103200, partial [Sesamum radiatum]
MKERDIVIDIKSCVDRTKKAGDPEFLDVEIREETKKEKRFSMSAKKPPKPPRPPRGLSLDAADQKLIKEISELARIKRARIERMKVLKRMKAAKVSSASASSSGSLIAMLTILFCIVIIFQGIYRAIFAFASFLAFELLEHDQFIDLFIYVSYG